MKQLFITGVLFFTVAITNGQDVAQNVVTPEQYIAMYKDLAIREMKRMGVPAAITLAQGLLETESGNSDLVKKSNNHFGIKCKSDWTGASVTHDDDASGECFRLYKTAEDSYRDHSNFLRGSDRYKFLFKLDVRDYQGWAYGLKKAGYATNPSYPKILIKNIEQYNLQQYTLIGADEVPKFDAEKYQDDKEEPVKDGNTLNTNAPGDNAPELMDKVITINGSKCVFTAKGTSVLAVAEKNSISINKLLSFNENLEDGLLPKNQFVFLEKKAKTGDKDFYIANAGETLYDIAQKNGIQLQSLLDYNKFWGNEDIKAGTKIYLKPNLAAAKPVIVPIAGISETPKTHIVEPKEGLYAISKKYNVSVQLLREWNNLQGDSISIGQELIISK